MIANEQELLERFYEAERVWIWERSAAITYEIGQLKKEVKEYAERNGLTTEFLK